MENKTNEVKNCGNCVHRNEKYKILGCRLHNKQVKKSFCCSFHALEKEAEDEGEKKNTENTDGTKCKYCHKEMVIVKNGKRDLFDENNWIYECHNEDCTKQPKLIINVCEACEHETQYWEG